MNEVEQVLKEEMDTPEPSVVIAKRPCILGSKMVIKKQYEIDFDACRGCRVCLKLGCPALELGDADPAKPKLRKVKVNPVLCAGCGMCQQVCTYDAVKEKVLEEAAR
jgi:indolepyruvate ferredoxin oxidoreductase alpha subunit